MIFIVSDSRQVENMAELERGCSFSWVWENAQEQFKAKSVDWRLLRCMRPGPQFAEELQICFSQRNVHLPT